MIEKNRATLQNQFDQWYNNLHSRGISALSSAARLHAAAESKEYSHAGTTSSNIGSSSQMVSSSIGSFRGSVGSGREDKSPTPGGLSSLSLTGGGSGIGGGEAKSFRSVSSRQDVKEDADDVNEDLQAFYQAKQDLLKRRQG